MEWYHSRIKGFSVLRCHLSADQGRLPKGLLKLLLKHFLFLSSIYLILLITLQSMLWSCIAWFVCLQYSVFSLVWDLITCQSLCSRSIKWVFLYYLFAICLIFLCFDWLMRLICKLQSKVWIKSCNKYQCDHSVSTLHYK